MSRLQTLFRSLRDQPGYTLMRGVARFATVRRLVVGMRRSLLRRRSRQWLADCEERIQDTLFPGLDRADFVRCLREDGVAFGLKLPASVVQEIRAWADAKPCYADRSPGHGFTLPHRAKAEARLGKPILVAQYFNAAQNCPAIARLVNDPILQAIACSYLESAPKFVGANLWWTFPVQALESDRDLHAHLLHRNVDDFRFFKFFFSLTDGGTGERAHVCVPASHRETPMIRAGDRWNICRYTDAEIEASFAQDKVLEICGPASAGFAENTPCVQKGRTPSSDGRLLFATPVRAIRIRRDARPVGCLDSKADRLTRGRAPPR